jgi:hypothetical protein
MQKNLYILLFLLRVCFTCSAHEKEIKLSPIDFDQFLTEVDQTSLMKLELFFANLVNENNFAYTLFGNKPCSIETYVDFFENPLSSNLFESINLENGWECWQNYRHLFPSENFILSQFHRNHGLEKFNTLILINKKATLEVIQKNLQTFQELLEISLSANEILNRISSKNNEEFLAQIMDKSQLFGILLGYGSKNSWGFERKIDLSLNIGNQKYLSSEEDSKDLEKISLILVRAFSKGSLKPEKLSHVPSGGFSTLTEELNSLTTPKKTFQLSGAEHLFEKHLSPVFSAFDDDPETQQLHEEYMKTRNVIIEKYKKGPFLKVTLSQWMGQSI